MHHVPDCWRPTVPPVWLRYEDLVRDARSLARKLLKYKFGTVVGVARSGLIPASIVAMHLHADLALYSPKTKQITFIGGGSRTQIVNPQGDALLVDDTTASLVTIELAKKETGITHAAAVYAAPGTEFRLVAFVKHLPFPHLLEWNFWNCCYLPYSATDLDGVLCRDPRPEDVASRQAYINWISTVEPIDGPRLFPVGWIVTCRPRWTKELTERWLRQHGFVYRQLVMPEEEILDIRRQAEWKAEVLATIRPYIYVESAPEIAAMVRPRLRDTIILVPQENGYAYVSCWRTEAGGSFFPQDPFRPAPHRIY